ncbi:coiled-coil-helix-coiled-coil-helix domain-containing protein 7 [Lethenteron reissneri]|uniref:coiled-coil-helix-coiled-coil-helix domain-containing protein 7 n=1 Tax=Lethenteron reissneri TaxID=7753 RepID=UPI002AB6C6B7|nr:coiled-coil-helix-coiled-coil-helix domain-containing protein 7 [Lethenteron reissneri]XP_061410229.1 coiled-coil-helix-coiled-coil-helix domain-containing protein 7 [Lethenteron reissneri]XP_061410230.1 coiled-coil-helix-coiled-coil-helix domain-containing protein 7 [Lethenteron reissneri]XP_061410231.1 coiled-coil-helix-coiled-coil-helix domain-containing protein 7 [Lethenteron reissneri]
MSKLRKLRDLDINPCLEETDASRKCMERNGYDRDVCTKYFIQYRNCRTFWNKIIVRRRGEGVEPAIPTAEERKRILEELGQIPY